MWLSIPASKTTVIVLRYIRDAMPIYVKGEKSDIYVIFSLVFCSPYNFA